MLLCVFLLRSAEVKLNIISICRLKGSEILIIFGAGKFCGKPLCIQPDIPQPETAAPNTVSIVLASRTLDGWMGEGGGGVALLVWWLCLKF